MPIEIKHRFSGAVLYSAGGESLRDAVVAAVKSSADLRGADLRGADLRGADLRDADLRGAGLSRADDNRLTLTGDRPFLSIGPIGSEHGDLNAYLTDYGVYVRRGCFFGSIDEFRAAVDRKHGGGDHAREYRAAIALIEAHAAIWSPATGGQS